MPDAATPAATVVPMRDGPSGPEVLMLRRNSRGSFGGMWVFPGGQIDGADRLVEGDEIAAARAASVREAWEEAGLVIDPAGMEVLSFWLPPQETPRRFATWFFLARVLGEAEVLVDNAEIHEHRWLTPAAALVARDAGEIELVTPTFTTLWWLAQQPSVAAALEAARSRHPERFETRMARSPSTGMAGAVWEGDAGYADGDLDRPGRRRRMLFDPAGWRMEISP